MNWNLATHAMSVVLCAILVDLVGWLSVKFFVTHNVHNLKVYIIKKSFCWVLCWVQSYCLTSRLLYCGKSGVSDFYMLVKCIAMRGGEILLMKGLVLWSNSVSCGILNVSSIQLHIGQDYVLLGRLLKNKIHFLLSTPQRLIDCTFISSWVGPYIVENQCHLSTFWPWCHQQWITTFWENLCSRGEDEDHSLLEYNAALFGNFYWLLEEPTGLIFMAVKEE